MRVSQSTVGHLINPVAVGTTHASLGAYLMRHSLGDEDPGQLPGVTKIARVTTALTSAFKASKETALLALAEDTLRNHRDDDTDPWVAQLLASLRTDGFECVATSITVTSGSEPWAPETIETTWSITPMGLAELPIAPLASDLAGQLTVKGFVTAAGHYQQALEAFHAGNWASSNSQLRTTFESVLLDLAEHRTGTRPASGGAANDVLTNNGDLTFGPEHYVRGLWKMSHASGSHPGLSDEDDARHRLYAVSAAIGWLVRSFG
ncbi:hypothetical protein [Rathayibacter festucae]|uniref:hypothetical protein n=1 Tax=Rathayibacter festucae TaxID=110937 RepID=UPI002A6A6B16|nr:hypothetical protein [Rathayibacter festucae]MDY0913669.1 hypothetical protein [Rathayibacter festucae]